jgi:protein phosphatase 1 regulatory subunit 7
VSSFLHLLLSLRDHRVLDLSFNNFKAVPETLHHLPSLSTVYFVQNRISRINGLESLGSTLRSLELGGNRIRVSSLLYFITGGVDPFYRK